MSKGWIGSLIVLGACAVDPGTASYRAAPNPIGVDAIDIHVNGNTTQILGLDKSGAQVAVIDLVRGQVPWETMDDNGVADRQIVDGRQLTINIRGTQVVEWSNPGDEAFMNFPLTPRKELNFLVNEPHVRAELAKWGLGWEIMVPTGAVDEMGYAVLQQSPWAGNGIRSYCGDVGNTYTSCGIQTGSTSFGNGMCGTYTQGRVWPRNSLYEDFVMFSCNNGWDSGGWQGAKTCHWFGWTGGSSSCGNHGPNAVCSNGCPGFGTGMSYPAGTQGWSKQNYGSPDWGQAWAGTAPGDWPDANYGCLLNYGDDGYCTW